MTSNNKLFEMKKKNVEIEKSKAFPVDNPHKSEKLWKAFIIFGCVSWVLTRVIFSIHTINKVLGCRLFTSKIFFLFFVFSDFKCDTIKFPAKVRSNKQGLFRLYEQEREQERKKGQILLLFTLNTHTHTMERWW